MEERVKTSFIPKASLTVERKEVRAGGQVALVNVITGVILVLAILISGGLFLFEGFTTQGIASAKASLDRSRAAFEPATIRELARLNARIETAKSLLKTHVALSKLFDELETQVLSSVRFSDFDYEISAGNALLNANGQASSFNAVALQANQFSKSAIVTDPIFSDVNIGKGGAIDFKFTSVINNDNILYGTGTAAPSVAPTSGTGSASTSPTH